MADPIDPAIQQAFREFAQQLNRFGASLGSASSATSGSLSGLGANLRTVGQGMARLRSEMDSGRKSFADSIQIYRQLKDDFEALDEATRATAAGQRIREAQNVMANQLVRQNLGELAGEITKIGIGGALTYYKNQLTTTISSLQENVGGMQMAFALQQQAVTDLYSNFEKMGQAVTAAGAGLTVINPIVGAFVTGVGLATSQIAAFTGAAETEALKVLQREFNKTGSAFRSITSAGLFFTNGMTEMRQEARLAQLDLADYSRVVSANSVDLAKLGGTVEAGAKRFSMVNSELFNYRQGLLNLGISEAEQAQATIDYMSMLQDVGKLQGKTNQQLAAETNDYLKNLKAISAITGEDAKKAQQRARDAATQAAVNNKLSQAGAGAEVKFKALIAQFPGLEKGISQLYTLGTVVDPIQAQILTSIPGLEQAIKYNVDQLEKPGQSIDQFNINLQESLRLNASSIRDQARAVQGTFGMINVATGNLGELSTLTTQYAIYGEKLLTKSTDFGEMTVNTLSDTFDPLTKETTRTQVLFNQFNSLLSNVLDGPLKDFATQGADIVKQAATKMIDSVAPLLKTHEIILRIDKNIDKVITDAVETALRASNLQFQFERYARGGIVNGPTRILAGESGAEAIIPLTNGVNGEKSVPVDLSIKDILPISQLRDMFPKDLNINHIMPTKQLSEMFPSDIKIDAVLPTKQLSDMFPSDLNINHIMPTKQLSDMFPADIKINESMAIKELHNMFTSALGQIKEDDFKKQTSLIQASTLRNENTKVDESMTQEAIAQTFSKSILDLKSQLAGDNDKQLGIMQQQIDKLDSLISHMRDNVAASENIANVLG